MADLPFNQEMDGYMTYYDTGEIGACGDPIDPENEDLVAVCMDWWTTDNPNQDPICQGVSVKVTYNGKSITVPVKDQLPNPGEKDHLDLSRSAFAQLADLDQGVVQGITWMFVQS
jgi:expansin (peptidoglycan-binding protein)